MDSKDNDSIHNSVRPPEIDCDEKIENDEKNDCKENIAYYETAYDKSIRKMEEREASQRKGAPNENNSYSTDEVKRLRWLVDDEGGLGMVSVIKLKE